MRIWQKKWSLAQQNRNILSLSRGVRAILGEECDNILGSQTGAWNRSKTEGKVHCLWNLPKKKKHDVPMCSMFVFCFHLFWIKKHDEALVISKTKGWPPRCGASPAHASASPPHPTWVFVQNGAMEPWNHHEPWWFDGMDGILNSIFTQSTEAESHQLF